MGKVQLVEGSTVADNGDAVKNDLLEFGGEGNGDFGGILDAGLIGDICNIVGVTGLVGEVGLEIEELIIIAVADLIGGWGLIEVRVNGVQPCGQGAGLNGGK